MSYDDVVRAIGEDAARRAIAFLGGAFTDDETVLFVADLLAASNSQAAAAGVLAYAASMHEATGHLSIVADPPSTAHFTDVERLRQAVASILRNRAADTPMQLRRLAIAEAAETAAFTYGDALQGDERVVGWRRVLNPGACQLCRWWSRNGRVWPAAHPIPRHKGCTCSQQPVVRHREAV